MIYTFPQLHAVQDVVAANADPVSVGALLTPILVVPLPIAIAAGDWFIVVTDFRGTGGTPGDRIIYEAASTGAAQFDVYAGRAREMLVNALGTLGLAVTFLGIAINSGQGEITIAGTMESGSLDVAAGDCRVAVLHLRQ